MRNNEQRFQHLPQNSQVDESVPTSALIDHPSPPSPFSQNVQPQQKAFQFSVPTSFVELPSKGKHYDSNHPYANLEEVELYFMTAKEEDILTSQTLIKKGIVLDKLLENLLVVKCDPRTLLEHDRTALLIEARKSGFGNLYQLSTFCPDCGEKMELSVDLGECVKYNEGVVEDLKDADVVQTLDGMFEYRLKSSKYAIEFRLITGHDDNQLFKQSEQKKKANKMESMFTDRLRQILTKVEGKAENVVPFVNGIPLINVMEIMDTYRKVCPNVKIMSAYECNKCGSDGTFEVPITRDFFWPNR